MDLRLRRLEHLDPLAVPLPHGTEVTTRVDRVLGERIVPQGAVGRVVKARDDEFDVHVVGVGVVRYGRSELVPTKIGQVQYAVRRESSWAALRPCAILETVVGSRAWGLADSGSDTDLRGVFAVPFSWTAGLVRPPADLVSADGSETLWEADKAVRQALRADPNTLETLFVPGARATDELGQWLLDERDAFASAQIYGSFGRYALSQLKRLQQSSRLAEHRDTVLAWLREPTPPSLDEIAGRLAKLDPRATPTEADAHLQAKQYVKHLYRSLHDQGLLEAADFASMVRFANDRAAALELPRELRPKNAYNLLRLIVTATRWLRDGSPRWEFDGAFRDRLLAIKKGDVPLSEVIGEAESRVVELEQARQNTRLPAHPDVQRADALLRRISEETARRWIERVPGPLGRDAAAPPEVQWEGA